MADDEGGSKDKGIHKVIPSKGDSPHRRREKIIVLGTIALVILTVVLVAHRASGGASGQTSDPGETGIAGPDDSTDLADGTTGSTGGSGGGGDSGGGGTTIIRGNRQVAALRKRLARQQALAKSRRSIIAGQHRTIAFQRQTINRIDHPVNHKGRHGQQHSAHQVIKPVIGNGRAPSRPIGTVPRHANR